MPETTPIFPELLQPFLTVFFALFGSLLGSFSNVVILRMAEGRSVVFPPSSCPHCNHQLSPLDLIPVFGWLFLRGKCRYCGAPISCQYPLVEATAAVLAGSAYARFGLHVTFIAIAAWSLIWLVVTVMHLRRENVSAQPFLWPLAYRLALGYFVAPFALIPWAAALGGGAITAALIRVRHPDAKPLIWFGTVAVNLLATQNLGSAYLAALPAILLLLAARPGEPGIKVAVPAMFLWNITGIALCAWTGNWGW